MSFFQSHPLINLNGFSVYFTANSKTKCDLTKPFWRKCDHWMFVSRLCRQSEQRVPYWNNCNRYQSQLGYVILDSAVTLSYEMLTKEGGLTLVIIYLSCVEARPSVHSRCFCLIIRLYSIVLTRYPEHSRCSKYCLSCLTHTYTHVWVLVSFGHLLYITFLVIKSTLIFCGVVWCHVGKLYMYSCHTFVYFLIYLSLVRTVCNIALSSLT